jgi:HEAT repeat protein
VPRVVEEVSSHPALVGELVAGLVDDDPIVRMRAADALEKVSRGNPALLDPFRDVLLNVAADSEQQEVRWHAAQMLPRLELAPGETEDVIRILLGYLNDRSSIVKVCALHALAELAKDDPRLVSRVRPVVARASRSGTPAMRARGRKLMLMLKK